MNDTQGTILRERIRETRDRAVRAHMEWEAAIKDHATACSMHDLHREDMAAHQKAVDDAVDPMKKAEGGAA